MADSIFMLRYIIDESFSPKLSLIVISVDFSKAFDIIKRGKLIEAMKKVQNLP